MDPRTELAHLRYSGKTDGRRHVARFERLVAEGYANAPEQLKWQLFVKTIQPDNKQHIAIDSPGGWLIGYSKTDAWRSGRLTYQDLRTAFLNRWSRVHRGTPDSPIERRMLEGPSSPESNASFHSGPTKTTIEIDSNKQKNQIVVSFPERKRKKSFNRSMQQQAPQSRYAGDGMDSPYSSDYYTRSPTPSDIDQPPPHHHQHAIMHHREPPKELVVVVNEEKALTKVEPPAPVAAAPATPMRPRLLEGRVCAITGASSGVGREIAMSFAREGAHIIAHYWGTTGDMNDDIVSLAVDIKGIGQGCAMIYGDITDPRTSELIIKKAVDTYGRLDVLVSTAGMSAQDPMDMPPEAFQRFCSVNFEGTYHLLRLAANQMASQNEDLKPEDPKPDYSIICVSSSSPSEIGNHNTPGKAVMASLAQSSALSLGSRGIRCNSILAANIERADEQLEGTALERRKILERMIPLRRVGKPEDIVGPAVFLASAMSRYVTGTTVTIDGGFAGSF